MRQIKFRGKRKDNGEWICGYLVKAKINRLYRTPVVKYFIFTDVEWVQDDFGRLEMRGFYEVIPETVGQFTGLKDNTKWEELTKEEQKKWLINKTKEEWVGKEIYEGDSVKYYGKIYKIVFYRGCFCLESKYGYEPLIDIIGEIKVIGNIFENFTLLKEEL